MRRLALVLAAATLIGCAKKEPEPAAEPPAAPVAPPAPAPFDMAAAAGTWDMKTMAADNDSVLVTYTLTATADTGGWMLNFPKRKPVALKVMVMGDSVMTESAEYESMLRKGVKVHTNSVFHLVNGQLTGNTTAHYGVKTADSVRMLRAMGTKQQK
ncbi:MAG: hypothetical protein ABIZ70_09885 [Gemmatimonadales bacterium]